MDLHPKLLNQLLLESDVFPNPTAVDDGIGMQAARDDGPLRQDTHGDLVRQRVE